MKIEGFRVWRWAVLALLVGGFALRVAPAAAYSASETNPADLGNYACERVGAGKALDLTGAAVTFEDEFFRQSIAPPEGHNLWYAPIHGGFGGARFLRPDDKFSPFSQIIGHLNIRMSYRDGKWYSGIIQTVNAKGVGFAQKYGYFEMRAQFPAGMGSWPAFWLKTVNQFTNPTETRAEIDVIEAYGGRDQFGHHSTVHLWPAAQRGSASLAKHWWKGCYNKIPGGLFDGQFHTYGGEITPNYVILYFDRKEVARFATLPEFKKPLFVLVDLAYNAQYEPRTDLTPLDMRIDYVRVWQRPQWRNL